MRRPKTKEDKALDQALDVLIAQSGHSPQARAMELNHVFRPTRQQAGSPKRQQAAAVQRLRLTHLNEKDRGMRTGESNPRSYLDSTEPLTRFQTRVNPGQHVEPSPPLAGGSRARCHASPSFGFDS